MIKKWINQFSQWHRQRVTEIYTIFKKLQEQEDINLWLYLYIISTLSVTCFHLNTGKSSMCCSRAWWHRSRPRLSLWLKTLLTGLIFDMPQLQQCEMRACRELDLHVFPQWYGSTACLKPHSGSRWTEYSRWKSLLRCILICWEQNYLGAQMMQGWTVHWLMT